MRRSLVTLALLCSLAPLAACGDDDDGDASSGTQAPITVAPVPVEEEPPVTTPGGARIVNPTPGLDGVAAATLDSVAVLDRGKLEARFYGGVTECYGVDRIEVEEGETSVTVTVHSGTRPEAAARACIDIAELQAVIVVLASPLNDRVVIDGSSGAEVPLS